MKLYTLPNSPNSRKVVAVMHHLGLRPDIACLDFARGDLVEPAFLALNPNAMVPVLVDGDLTLWESNAINQYLVQKAGGSDLFPADPKVRADIARWQFWEQAHFNRAFGTQLRDDEVDTIGGLLMHRLGRLPVRGEEIELEGLKVQVLRADSRRIHTLLVERLPEVSGVAPS